ncbi:MAG: hypothetical protein SVR94_19455, partial [Pseudomonadota bacterium]|nr:hypothetical protein [Pseudomonadota bacterium]
MNDSSHVYALLSARLMMILGLLMVTHTVVGANLRVAGDRTENTTLAPSAPTVVGQIERTAKRIEYLQESSYTQTFRYPNASYVKLHLRRFDLPAGDFITISNPAGSEQYTYPGDPITTDEQPGFWALS